MCSDQSRPNTDLATILVDHYQKTFELTLEMWKYRNRTFLYLVGVIGLASFLSVPIQESQSILVIALGGLLQISESQVNELRTTFPFELFQITLLVVIFYLMVNLYHRSHFVLRNYQYLNKLEGQIRDCLGIETGIAFTREGDFYWSERPRFMGLVKFVYMGIIGGLLGLFFYHRILVSEASDLILKSIEVALALATLLFYVAYIRASYGLDSKQRQK